MDTGVKNNRGGNSMPKGTTNRAKADRAAINPRIAGKEGEAFNSEGISETVRSVYMNRLLRRKEVEQLVGLSRASLYRLADLGDFPHPVRVGPRAVRWRLGDIEQWISERPPTTQRHEKGQSRACTGIGSETRNERQLTR